MVKNAEAKLIGKNGKLFNSVLENSDLDLENCFQGSPYENLSEFAGRLCYKSGHKGQKNRNSKEYHQHILEVGHHSIYGHNTLNFKCGYDLAKDWAYKFANKPGWYLTKEGDESHLLTVNFRFIGRVVVGVDTKPTSISFFFVLNEAAKVAPLIFTPIPIKKIKLSMSVNPSIPTTLEENNQTWYSFLIKTSRRVAQELTRHGFETAISMESTRYVDQSENGLILHPFVTLGYKGWFDSQMYTYQKQKNIYTQIVNEKNPDMDKLYIRKQVSGACASFLPLGLETNLVFSCSKREFEEICRQRISVHADAEISQLVTMMKDEVDKDGN